MSVLFLSHRIPFPPDRGDKIRSHHILKALAGMGPVHVGCFADTLPDKIHEPALAKHSKSYRLVWRGKPLWLADLQALFQRKPVSLRSHVILGMSASMEGSLQQACFFIADQHSDVRPFGEAYLFGCQQPGFAPVYPTRKHPA